MSSLVNLSLKTPSAPLRKRIRKLQALQIGLVTDAVPGSPGSWFTMQFCEQLVHGMRDHRVILLRGGANLREQLDRQVQGVLAVGCSDDTIDELQHLLHVPSVMVNRAAVCEMSAVSIDGRRQGELAVEHFHQRGHRRIAMLLDHGDNWMAIQRTIGFVGTMKRLGLQCPKECIVTLEHQPIYSVLQRLMSGLRPTAIFAAAEMMAVETLYVLRDVLRFSVPRDVSLIGMDVPGVSEFTAPTMTVITQPIDTLVTVAVQTLLRKIRMAAYDLEVLNIRSDLVERASVHSLHTA